MTERYPSPSGRFAVSATPFEMRMSHWVYPPVIEDTHSGTVLVSLADTLWSLDTVTWDGEATATLSLRKYPGSDSVQAHVDCERRTVAVGGRPEAPLDTLEQELESALR